VRFRGFSLALAVGLAIFAGHPRSAAAQDFDPRGRRHGGADGATRSPAAPAPKAPRPSRSAPPSADPSPKGDPRPEKGEAKGPGAVALIARYTAIVLAQPASPFPLQRLAQLYRERDGNLKALVSDFERRARDPGAEQWQATVALAGIYVTDGRPEEAITTYQSAIAARP
jgi:hypothetical protein